MLSDKYWQLNYSKNLYRDDLAAAIDKKTDTLIDNFYLSDNTNFIIMSNDQIRFVYRRYIALISVFEYFVLKNHIMLFWFIQ